MKSNAEYWEKRILRDKKKAINDEKLIQKQLNKIYKDSFKELEKDIMTLFQRYANDNGLTYSDAIKYLTSKEFSEWRMDLSEYIELIEKTGDEKLLLELNTLAMKSRISRLEQLTYQVNKQLNKCFTYSNDIVKELLEKSVVNAYSDSAKNVNYAYGIEATKSIAKERVTKILMEPWSGANFSESIWSNRDKLAGVVRNELTKGIYQGKSSQRICNEISKRMEGSKDDIMRVVRTERSHAVNKAKLEQYKDTGFEYYKYKAAVGQDRTCERCRKVHKESGKEPIKLSEAIEGENFPPLHSNCRCTVVPFMSSIIISKEDKEDFEKFKKAGVDVPDNIEDFVKIKYNDYKEWGMIKDYLKYVKNGELSPLAKYSLYKEMFFEIDKKLIGIELKNGVVIKRKSKHFTCRVIGSIEDRRNGVSIEECIKILKEPDEIKNEKSKNGKKSQKLVKYGFGEISINNETGNLIQVNPKGEKGVRTYDKNKGRTNRIP